jgi:hypothetical protein
MAAALAAHAAQVVALQDAVGLPLQGLESAGGHATGVLASAANHHELRQLAKRQYPVIRCLGPVEIRALDGALFAMLALGQIYEHTLTHDVSMPALHQSQIFGNAFTCS